MVFIACPSKVTLRNNFNMKNILPAFDPPNHADSRTLKLKSWEPNPSPSESVAKMLGVEEKRKPVPLDLPPRLPQPPPNERYVKPIAEESPLSMENR